MRVKIKPSQGLIIAPPANREQLEKWCEPLEFAVNHWKAVADMSTGTRKKNLLKWYKLGQAELLARKLRE